MTKVYLEQSGKRYFVSSQGHATGSPEVCAAASCLVYTLAGWLHNSDAQVQKEQLGDGSALLVFAGGDNVEAVFDAICVGFLQLQQEHPEYISAQVILN